MEFLRIYKHKADMSARSLKLILSIFKYLFFMKMKNL